MIDIVAERFDASVRFGSRVADEMIAVRISEDVVMAVVATPDYFHKFGIPETPQDLRNHQCIGCRLRTQGGMYAWEFQQNGLEIKVKIEGQWVFNESHHIANAVRAELAWATFH